MGDFARVRSTHPWIHVGGVVFAADSIGIGETGEPARVERDVIVTAILPSPDGTTLVELRPFTTERPRTVGPTFR